MTHKVLIIIMLFCSQAFAQIWQVSQTVKLSRVEEGLYFYPRFSADGSKIFVSGDRYNGLSAIDLNSRQKVLLTTSAGAGYQPVFSADGKKIYFKRDEYIAGRKKSALVELDMDTRVEISLTNGDDLVLPPILATEQILIYKSRTEVKSLNLNTKAAKAGITIERPVIFTGDRSMVLVHRGENRTLTPMGDGHYIWASVSPDQTKVLFTLAGRGTYICDLEGKIIHELGRAHAPGWSPDGNWIVYMDDRDDGHTYTGSDIYITSADGEKRFRLTSGDLVAMYPSWSPEGKRITFHSYVGEIYLLQLQFEEGN